MAEEKAKKADTAENKDVQAKKGKLKKKRVIKVKVKEPVEKRKKKAEEKPKKVEAEKKGKEPPKKAEKPLKGNRINATLVQKAAQPAAVESNPITHVMSSAEYRTETVAVFVKRTAMKAIVS